MVDFGRAMLTPPELKLWWAFDVELVAAGRKLSCVGSVCLGGGGRGRESRVKEGQGGCSIK